MKGCAGIWFVWMLLAGPAAWASSVSFSPRELFRVPFGESRERLGKQLDGGNLIIPRGFTMDAAGHFYIYDINHHRVARFSSEGRYEMEWRYPATAGQMFAHADTRENLWLLVSDPAQGLFYGVYDGHGRNLRSGTFSQFNHFRLHPGDDNVLHVILSSDQKPETVQTWFLDEKTLLMKKENVGQPPEAHHQIRHHNHVYFIDEVPGGSGRQALPVNRVTDESHRGIAEIQGTVVYVTGRGEVYARVNDREIRVYEPDGAFKGRVLLKGLSSACLAVRFDPDGNIYELDGIPDKAGQYGADMSGMRLIQWERR